MPRIYVFLITLLASFQLLARDSKPEIIFVSDNQASPSIDFASAYLYRLQSQLSHKISFDSVRSSHRREWRLLTDLPNVCVYNKVKNSQRELLAEFTQYPITVFPPNRLIVFNAKGLPYSVSLTDMVNTHKLRVGIVEGRSYGEALDQEIATIKPQLVVLSGYLSAMRLREMFMQGKLDAIIEYSAVLLHDENINIPIEHLSFHQLSNAKEFIYGYIACSKSREGKYAIKLFNQQLHLKSNIEELIKVNQAPFPETEHKAIENTFKKLHTD
ncbi:ABC transporter substrate-binding protein [Psychrobium sp. 1_MG-2023]|uniref:ABC transporter substrate-binding protein n=1 Tax=Psychrobium sp. 1_MG-2023 TaxID=3062624 RepID=UPI000C345824|nr:ABC transporter substrate-binding protein [Psychrobium sp. 1_MG-2023]MDP2559666.1 ABC transporter substrate-binding protein [Psychrobium sp. 1_MG-2023]PKF59497.1 ABC transporter substrate-binding protein [Alteromonadales bacterium alter-6D02]